MSLSLLFPISNWREDNKYGRKMFIARLVGVLEVEIPVKTMERVFRDK